LKDTSFNIFRLKTSTTQAFITCSACALAIAERKPRFEEDIECAKNVENSMHYHLFFFSSNVENSTQFILVLFPTN